MSGADSPELWREARSVPLARLSDSTRDALGGSRLKVLRAQVDFERVDELKASLDALSALLWRAPPEVTLVQVRYNSETLSAEARQVHEAFAARHPEASTYLPLCLPPSPLGALASVATPHDCAGCIFREGGRCDGLGSERALTPSIALSLGMSLGVSQAASSVNKRGDHADGALADTLVISTRADTRAAIDSDSHTPISPGHLSRAVSLESLSPSPELIAAERPPCYWWPEPRHLSVIAEAFIDHDVRVLWDLGAGNGYLTELMVQLASRVGAPLDEALSIDPVISTYPERVGVRQWSGDATSALEAARAGRLRRPDALMISWPAPGLSYAELIYTLRPRLVLRMTDRVGVCGVRTGHRALSLAGQTATWFELRESLDMDEMSSTLRGGGVSSDEFQVARWDDLTPPRGYAVRAERDVWSYRDLRGLDRAHLESLSDLERPSDDSNSRYMHDLYEPSGVLQITERSGHEPSTPELIIPLGEPS